jgi:hypothetical protein
MADTVNEIYNSSISLSDVASTGKTTLITTDANTRYVIKDVYVNGALAGATDATLIVNNMPVAEVTGSVAGSEIVDINSTVSYQAFAAAPSIQVVSFEGFTSPYAYRSSVYGALNGTVSANYSAATSTDTPLNTAISASSGNFLKATNGDVFYVFWDGNSQAFLYKRPGGPNGTETAIVGMSYGWIVSNGVDSFHYCNNGQSIVATYNINTGVTTSVSGYGEALSSASYPSATYMNSGKILVNTTGNSDPTRLLIVNPYVAQRLVVNLNNVSNSGQAYKISGFLDPVTGLYTFFRRIGTQLNVAQLGSVAALSGTYSGPISQLIVPVPVLLNNNYIEQTSSTYSYAKHSVTGKTDIAVVNLSTGIADVKAFLPFSTTTAAFNIKTTAAPASAFTGSVNLRITGVKSV